MFQLKTEEANKMNNVHIFEVTLHVLYAIYYIHSNVILELNNNCSKADIDTQ